MLYDTLSFIGEQLNKHNVTWAIGGAVMLKHYGLEDRPRNIELFIDTKDIECAVEIMNKIGKLQVKESSNVFATTHYHKYLLNNNEVGLISDMKINHELGTYTYKFDISSVYDHMTVNHIPIPVTSLEDWYLIYQLFPEGEPVVSAIESYFEENDIMYPEILKEKLSLNIPETIKSRLLNTINNPTFLLEQIKNLPKNDYKTSKFINHFKKIEKIIKEFDKRFNNTVVDTRAFYQVIKSDEIVNAIYYYMYMPEFRMKNGLLGLKRAITKYTIYEVEKSYQNSGHSVFEPTVYYDYIDRLIDRIQSLRQDELSLESIIQTKLIYDRINEMNSLLTSTLETIKKKSSHTL